MKAINLPCERCGARAGEKCIEGAGSEKRNKSGIHVSRAYRAKLQTIAEKRERAARNQKIAEEITKLYEKERQ